MFKKVLSLLVTVTFITSPIISSAQSFSSDQVSPEMLIELLLEIIEAQEKEKQRAVNQPKYTLQVGARGSRVTELQNFLVKEGVYPEAIVSGYYGNLTEKAVQNLRKKHNLLPYRGFSSELYSQINPVQTGAPIVPASNYAQWVEDTLELNSYRSSGSVDFSVKQVGRSEEVEVEFYYDVTADFEDAVFEIVVDGVVDISGFVDISVPFEAAMIFKNDNLYFNIMETPKGLLTDDLLDQWVVVDLDEIASDMGLDYSDLKNSFAESYQDLTNQSGDNSGFVTVTKSRDQSGVASLPAASEGSVVNYDLKVDLDGFMDAVFAQLDEQAQNNPFVALSLENQKDFYGQILSKLSFQIGVLDDSYIVASDVQFDDIIVGQERESIFGGTYKEPDTDFKLQFSERLSDLDKRVSIDTPRNPRDFEEYANEAEDAINEYMDDLFGFGQARTAAGNSVKINNVKQAALAMELARSQATGEFPTDSRYPDEAREFLSPFPEDIEWEDNRRYPTRFCVWSELDDSNYGKYFVASQTGADYSNIEPKSITSCLIN